MKMKLAALLGLSMVLTGCYGNKNTEGSVQSHAMYAQEEHLSIQEKSQAANAFIAKSVIYFDYDQAHLSQEAKTELNTLADALLADTQRSILIAGHTDQRGTKEYNMVLGQRRAQAVSNYLIEKGVASSQLRTVSYGKQMLASLEENEDSYKLNRRAQIHSQ
jgi:peptidoglycan-associated lipoprotein